MEQYIKTLLAGIRQWTEAKISSLPDRGSWFFNGSTQANILVTGYNQEMRIGDMIIDNGDTVPNRRGNIYRIEDIISQSPDDPIVQIDTTNVTNIIPSL